jgi:protein-L-isoaspartate(D-aspartate) O-methyltransferase
VTPEALGELRARLVQRLRARGDVRSDAVAAAFGRVPRHVFVRTISAAEAYADRSIAIKFEDGVAISSSSQPAIMAEMLEMLALRAGDRVLEIGAGSGYNAALLAEIVGPSGSVTSVDIDPGLVADARRRLDEAGYERVRVLCADGVLGDEAGAPFDAVIAAVGVERIPAAWIAQLRDGGRLVAPLTIRSLQKVVAFERTGDGLESRAVVDAAFMMLRGASASSDTRVLPLRDGTVTIRLFAERADRVDARTLDALLRGPRADARTSRRIAPEEAWTPFALWLALEDDGFCRVTKQDGGAPRASIPSLVPEMDEHYGFVTTLGVCDADAIVVLFARAQHDVALRRFGRGTAALARVQSALAAWDAAGRPGNRQLRITVAADGTTFARLGAA